MTNKSSIWSDITEIVPFNFYAIDVFKDYILKSAIYYYDYYYAYYIFTTEVDLIEVLLLLIKAKLVFVTAEYSILLIFRLAKDNVFYKSFGSYISNKERCLSFLF